MRTRDAHVNSSPASSITKLGIVRFVISEKPILPTEEARPGGVMELPSFSSDGAARPTVQMPPLADPCGPPAPVGEGAVAAAQPPPDEPAAAPASASAPTPQRERVSTLLGMMRIP